jgi:hypothetical protein
LLLYGHVGEYTWTVTDGRSGTGKTASASIRLRKRFNKPSGERFARILFRSTCHRSQEIASKTVTGGQFSEGMLLLTHPASQTTEGLLHCHQEPARLHLAALLRLFSGPPRPGAR